MKLTKIVLFSLTYLTATSAFALEHETEIKKLITTIYNKESYSQYASPELKSLSNQAHKIARKVDPDMECELAEHYDLGLDQDNKVKNIRIAQANDLIKVTFSNLGNKSTAYFDIKCQDENCLINNIFSEGTPKNGIKAKYQSIIRSKSCN